MTIEDWEDFEASHAESASCALLPLKHHEMSFRLPAHMPPAAFKAAHAKESALSMKKGTTTLAFRFKDGVIVACDSRASQGIPHTDSHPVPKAPSGSFIASQTTRKIIEINEYLLGTMAGGAADCVFWERYLSEQCRVYELRNGERISVAHASNIFANILYNYRGYGLSCGVMITGYDSKKKSASLYFVDDTGTRLEGDLFSVGSGSTYAYGVLDTRYRWDLTVEEAHDLARRAIVHATHRDGASGGLVRVYWVNEKGWEVLTHGDDVSKSYYEYYGH